MFATWMAGRLPAAGAAPIPSRARPDGGRHGGPGSARSEADRPHQDGQEDRRALESHFGAWVVCTEQPTPFVVTALDANGSVLGSVSW
jgi:hypothetical protein